MKHFPYHFFLSACPKTLLGGIIILCSSITSEAQSWGNWIETGNGIQISFKFGRTPCAFANTYARVRNVSGSEYCFVTVSFSSICDNTTKLMSISANHLKPGQVKESSGDSFETSLKVLNIKLTRISNTKCETIAVSNRSVSGQNAGFSIDQSGIDNVNLNNQQALKELQYSQQRKKQDDSIAYEILKARERNQGQTQQLQRNATTNSNRNTQVSNSRKEELLKEQSNLQNGVQERLEQDRQSQRRQLKEIIY